MAHFIRSLVYFLVAALAACVLAISVPMDAAWLTLAGVVLGACAYFAATYVSMMRGDL